MAPSAVRPSWSSGDCTLMAGIVMASGMEAANTGPTVVAVAAGVVGVVGRTMAAGDGGADKAGSGAWC